MLHIYCSAVKTCGANTTLEAPILEPMIQVKVEPLYQWKWKWNYDYQVKK